VQGCKRQSSLTIDTARLQRGEERQKYVGQKYGKQESPAGIKQEHLPKDNVADTKKETAVALKRPK